MALNSWKSTATAPTNPVTTTDGFSLDFDDVPAIVKPSLTAEKLDLLFDSQKDIDAIRSNGIAVTECQELSSLLFDMEMGETITEAIKGRAIYLAGRIKQEVKKLLSGSELEAAVQHTFANRTRLESLDF